MRLPAVGFSIAAPDRLCGVPACRGTGVVVLALALGLGSLAGCASDHPPGPAVGAARSYHDRTFGASIEAGVRYGPVRGFAQTPAGGTPGSTSPRRPTFDEVGSDTVSPTDIALRVHLGGHGLFGAMHSTRLSGEARLDRLLVSQGVTYPAGTAVEADVSLDILRVGYRYRFVLVDDEQGRPVVELSPSGELAYLYVDYALRGSRGLRSGRGYRNETPRAGAELRWRLADGFTLEAEAVGSIPLEGYPDIYTLRLGGELELWDDYFCRGAAMVGLTYDYIDFEGKQSTPNHVRAQIGPAAMVALRVSF